MVTTSNSDRNPDHNSNDGSAQTPIGLATIQQMPELKGRRVLIACDHAAFDLKEQMKKTLSQIEWIDCGTFSAERVDYPDFADQLIQRQLHEHLPGVLLCGSGQGMALRANRYPHVRAAVVWSEESARLAREHNDCNIITLGSRLVDTTLCMTLVQIFLTTPFAGGRHLDRVHKIDAHLVS